MPLLSPQRGHRRQKQASLYPSSASTWAQETGASFSVPFLRLNVGTGDRSKLLCTLLPPQRGHRRQEQASLYPSSASAWAQETGASFSVPFFRLSVNSLWVWEACFVADTHKLFIVWVWEACFIADTHTMKSLWVSEVCFVADTQIVKTGRYNKGIIYSRMHAASIRGVYGSPTLRAMHPIHKCVAKDAPHLFH